MKPTAEYVREVFNYDPETGILTWAKPRPRVQAGNVAGNVSKSSKGYRCVGLDNKVYKAHRLIWLYMTGEWPTHQVDHEDGIKDNNRWPNLRNATNQQNCFNRKRRKNNTSGETGVFWCNTWKRWKAAVSKDGKFAMQRSFHNKEDAIEAVRAKRAELFGEFDYRQCD